MVRTTVATANGRPSRASSAIRAYSSLIPLSVSLARRARRPVLAEIRQLPAVLVEHRAVAEILPQGDGHRDEDADGGPGATGRVGSDANGDGRAVLSRAVLG